MSLASDLHPAAADPAAEPAAAVPAADPAAAAAAAPQEQVHEVKASPFAANSYEAAVKPIEEKFATLLTPYFRCVRMSSAALGEPRSVEEARAVISSTLSEADEETPSSLVVQPPVMEADLESAIPRERGLAADSERQPIYHLQVSSDDEAGFRALLNLNSSPNRVDRSKACVDFNCCGPAKTDVVRHCEAMLVIKAATPLPRTRKDLADFIQAMFSKAADSVVKRLKQGLEAEQKQSDPKESDAFNRMRELDLQQASFPPLVDFVDLVSNRDRDRGRRSDDGSDPALPQKIKVLVRLHSVESISLLVKLFQDGDLSDCVIGINPFRPDPAPAPFVDRGQIREKTVVQLCRQLPPATILAFKTMLEKALEESEVPASIESFKVGLGPLFMKEARNRTSACFAFELCAEAEAEAIDRARKAITVSLYSIGIRDIFSLDDWNLVHGLCTHCGDRDGHRFTACKFRDNRFEDVSPLQKRVAAGIPPVRAEIVVPERPPQKRFGGPRRWSSEEKAAEPVSRNKGGDRRRNRDGRPQKQQQQQARSQRDGGSSRKQQSASDRTAEKERLEALELAALNRDLDGSWNWSHSRREQEKRERRAAKLAEKDKQAEQQLALEREAAGRAGADAAASAGAAARESEIEMRALRPSSQADEPMEQAGRPSSPKPGLCPPPSTAEIINGVIAAHNFRPPQPTDPAAPVDMLRLAPQAASLLSPSARQQGSPGLQDSHIPPAIERKEEQPQFDERRRSLLAGPASASGQSAVPPRRDRASPPPAKESAAAAARLSALPPSVARPAQQQHAVVAQVQQRRAAVTELLRSKAPLATANSTGAQRPSGKATRSAVEKSKSFAAAAAAAPAGSASSAAVKTKIVPKPASSARPASSTGGHTARGHGGGRDTPGAKRKAEASPSGSPAERPVLKDQRMMADRPSPPEKDKAFGLAKVSAKQDSSINPVESNSGAAANLAAAAAAAAAGAAVSGGGAANSAADGGSAAESSL
jgi:hypothetical protein